MKILLIRAGDWKNKANFFTAAPSSHPPLGLLLLGAVLEKDGHNVEILDYHMENVSRSQLEKSMISSDAVGMSIYTYDLKPAVNISKTIKEIESDIPLIIGGPHSIFFQERSLKDIPYADISVIGEGERVILDIVRFLQGKKKLADINGIYYRDNGSIISGKPLQVIKNLDEFPFPAHHLVEKYDYGVFPFGLKLKKKVTALISSRGCPFRCRFCTRYSNFIDEWGFRQRSADNIIQEIEEIDEKYRSLLIVDDNFLADKKRAIKIFDGLIEMGRDTELAIEGARVDSADRRLYLKMKKAGVKYLFLGIESGNQDVLDFYNKKITLQKVQEAVNLAREMNFFIMATFMFGAPIETKKHIENTINFACSLPLDLVGFGPLAYIRGSQLWKEAVESNKISKDSFSVFTDSEKGLGNLTRKEIRYYSNLAYQRFYFRPKYLFSQIYRNVLRNDYSILFNGFRFLLSQKNVRTRKITT